MIDPIAWLAVANERRPLVTVGREWNPGTVAPSRPDWYERHFTDSMIMEIENSLHYWDGHHWASSPGGKPHWRQVGDYPAWRETDLRRDDAKRTQRSARASPGSSFTSSHRATHPGQTPEQACPKSSIDPIAWLATANKRRPQEENGPAWNVGTTAPPHPGWYERHFIDSMIMRVELSLHYWDGQLWRSRPGDAPHWRQLGDYPAWRETALRRDSLPQAA